MISLSSLASGKTNTKRVGRGIGSGKGKTSGRGHKGAKSRSGYKRRLGQEGGQLPMHRRLPTRGFSNAQFKNLYFTINFFLLDLLFSDGEVVCRETLVKKGLLGKNSKLPIKILGKGKLTKKLTFKVDKLSEGAKKALEELSISVEIIKKEEV